MNARTWVALAIMVGLVLAGSRARANGRYPLADQIVIDPGNPAHIVARATFGVLDSDDGGKSFRWICETAIGYFGPEDPPIAVTANGSAVVASSKGLSISADGGCTWIRNPGLTGTWFGIDVTVLPPRPHEALGLLSYLADGAYTVSIVKTIDDGATWEEVVSSLDTSFLATTIEVAPSNPDRLYVSGKVLPGGGAAMMRSDDGGHTWTQFPLPLSGAYSIFIGAVDPHDPDVVYVRTNADETGRVLVSKDAGMSWNEIWQAPGDVSGFALSSDGAVLAVGGSAVGVSVASTTDFAFRRTSNASVYCLTFWGERLLVCTKEAIDHFSIGVSDDLGQHFEPLLHLSDVLPRACASGTSAGICASDWEMVATAIGADAGTGRPNDDGGDAGSAQEAHGCGCSLAALHDRHRRAPLELLAIGVVMGARAGRGFRRARRTRC
ncbi:MAG TPA: hypothetical protein VK550_09720 [Polyangiaceae bacterium]|nr:hypothetical protein [Polyangiaceae bacterium]